MQEECRSLPAPCPTKRPSAAHSSTAGIPSVLEPVDLDRGDGRRQDGLTAFPFTSGKCLAWDATCTDAFSDSAVADSAVKPGSAALAAESRKTQRYASISAQYLFVPLTVETSGVVGLAAINFIKELGRRISSATGERRETAWLWQEVSMAIIRGSAAAIRGSASQPAMNVDTSHRIHRQTTSAQGENFVTQGSDRGNLLNAPSRLSPLADQSRHSAQRQ